MNRLIGALLTGIIAALVVLQGGVPQLGLDKDAETLILLATGAALAFLRPVSDAIRQVVSNGG